MRWPSARPGSRTPRTSTGCCATRSRARRGESATSGWDLDKVLATLRGLLLLEGAATLAATGAGLAWPVRRSLRPLDRVAGGLAALGPDDLAARLDPAGVPAELLRVNELLGRLEAAFERERAFAADVAHELRTPLAGPVAITA